MDYVEVDILLFLNVLFVYINDTNIIKMLCTPKLLVTELFIPPNMINNLSFPPILYEYRQFAKGNQSAKLNA